MSRGIKYTGVISCEELKSIPGVPSQERIEKGPVAFIECSQKIPCNPCQYACKLNAIYVGQEVTNLPVIDEVKCTGCGKCIAKCPGLAIFTVHKNYTETTSTVSFPYEYFPEPNLGDVVKCADREGKFAVEGKILNVNKETENDSTIVVTVEVPKAYYNIVRTIVRRS